MAKGKFWETIQTISNNIAATKQNKSNNRAAIAQSRHERQTAVRVARAENGTGLGGVLNNYTDKVIAPVMQTVAGVGANYLAGKMGGGVPAGGGSTELPTTPAGQAIQEAILGAGNGFTPPAAPAGGEKAGFFGGSFLSTSNPFLWIIGGVAVLLGILMLFWTSKKPNRKGGRTV